MNNNKVIDYHIEIMALQEFSNSLLEKNKITDNDGKIIFDCLKRVIISEDVKPFLLGTAQFDPGKANYYKKYLFQEKNQNDLIFIPDFFSFNEDFYDIARPHNISLNNATAKEFAILFNLKLLEVESSGLQIMDFLNFQLYDNFLGDKMRFESFLFNLQKSTKIFTISTEITDSIKQWIKENDPEDGLSLYSLIVDDIELEDDISSEIDKHDLNVTLGANTMASDEEIKDFKIEGKFSEEEILKFFSFLYIEKSCGNKPFLEEGDLKDIFKNGLIIPANQPTQIYKLNCDPRYPRKIIDFGIHLFYTLNSKTRQDKLKYFQFFGNYISDYADAIKSDAKLTSLASNISGEKSSRSKVVWTKYLPERYRNTYF